MLLCVLLSIVWVIRLLLLALLLLELLLLLLLVEPERRGVIHGEPGGGAGNVLGADVDEVIVVELTLEAALDVVQERLDRLVVRRHSRRRTRRRL